MKLSGERALPRGGNRVRLTVSIASTLGLLAALALQFSFPAQAVAQGVRSHNGSHWYAEALSGTGSIGTEIRTNMLASYYAPAGTTTDEAAWLFNAGIIGQNDSAVELGWFQGYWPYSGPNYGHFFSYPQGYETEDGGANLNKGWIQTGRLPASTQLQFQINQVAGASTLVRQVTRTSTSGRINTTQSRRLERTTPRAR